MIILGIDPGTTRIGFGFIDFSAGRFRHLKSGLLKIGVDPQKRLLVLEKDLTQLISEFKPELVGLEKLFFVKNQKTAFEVAETRGVIKNTVLKNKIRIIELSPSELKLGITGDGRAPKNAISKMVGYFLNLSTHDFIDDVTDALALAIVVCGKNRFLSR